MRRSPIPFWERTKKLGIKNLCVHKGLPLGAFNEKACTPGDLEKAAKDWPDLNFIVYHSGFRGYFWLRRRHRRKSRSTRKTPDEQEIPWISDIFRILKKNPKLKNIYFELGSTFAQLSHAQPESAATCSGRCCIRPGRSDILWGTDSIWNGSPQSQIVRFRRLKMPGRADRKI